LESAGVLDFGGQYTHLIAKAVRRLGFKSVVIPFDSDLRSAILTEGVKALILSGGPYSVDEKAEFLRVASEVAELAKSGIPVLGICFGHQLIAYYMGSKLEKGGRGEFGRTRVFVVSEDSLFSSVPREFTAWMSHNDSVTELPEGFEVLAISENGVIAAYRHKEIPVYGVQFHPEVTHTEHGSTILKNFLSMIAGLRGGWNPTAAATEIIEKIRVSFPSGNALVAVSGGVDSVTTAVMLLRALGQDRVHALFVDTGLMREGEAQWVEKRLRELGFKFVHVVDASREFIESLRGVKDPEEKRRIVAEKFREVLSRAVRELERAYGKFSVFGQGTIYPDRVESGATGSYTKRIKSHHNVVMGALEGVATVEPLSEFYKDEVREIAASLRVPEDVIKRHPFPGPGLAVRVLGEVTEEKLNILRKVTTILEDELKKEGLYDEVWQAFPVLLPVKSVGVKGDSRAYGYIVSLRVVESVDAMTADFARLPWDLLSRIAGRIVREVPEVTRVLYDITSKPPATIEYE